MRPRLPAEERRAAVLDTACRVFGRCSYRSATTAEIAREAGVTEPILYRHFDSKRALYLACVDETWDRIRVAWDDAVADEDDPGNWLPGMGRAFVAFKEHQAALANLWAQALAEAGTSPSCGVICAGTFATCTSTSPAWSSARRRQARSRASATRRRRRGSFWPSGCSQPSAAGSAASALRISSGFGCHDGAG